MEPLIALAGEQAADAVFTADWKSALQEWLQATGKGLPVYRLAAAEGPDHRKRFVIELLVGGELVSIGEGRAKKEAEQLAARGGLAKLRPDAAS
jgi:ribonuclease-3